MGPEITSVCSTPRLALIPKSQELSPCPAAWLAWWCPPGGGWVKSPSRSVSCRQIPQLNESISWACLNIAPNSQTPRSYRYPQDWKLLPSMLSTGTLMVQFQSWSSYTIGVPYPSIFWMIYSSSLSILSAVLLASSSSFWEIDDLSITHIHCLVSTYP